MSATVYLPGVVKISSILRRACSTTYRRPRSSRARGERRVRPVDSRSTRRVTHPGDSRFARVDDVARPRRVRGRGARGVGARRVGVVRLGGDARRTRGAHLAGGQRLAPARGQPSRRSTSPPTRDPCSTRAPRAPPPRSAHARRPRGSPRGRPVPRRGRSRDRPLRARRARVPGVRPPATPPPIPSRPPPRPRPRPRPRPAPRDPRRWRRRTSPSMTVASCVACSQRG